MAPKDDDKPVELLGETESNKKSSNGKKEASKSSSPTNAKKKKGKSGDKNTGDIIDNDDENVLSEEDRELKERLETCVSTLINEAHEISVTPPIRLKAMEIIVAELRSATSSMTSVPKPLKFLRPKFDVLKKYYGSIADASNKVEIEKDKDMVFLRARLADVLAVLSMTLGKHGKCASLLFFGRHCLVLYLG